MHNLIAITPGIWLAGWPCLHFCHSPKATAADHPPSPAATPLLLLLPLLRLLTLPLPLPLPLLLGGGRGSSVQFRFRSTLYHHLA